MNRLELWIADAESFGVISKEQMQSLSGDEMLRSREIVSAQEKKRYILSRILLRKCLSKILGGEPRGWNFINGQTGKVSLAHHHGLPLTDFSLSYTGSAIVAAVSTAGRVGLGIESVDVSVFQNAAVREVVSAALTKRELRFLESRSPDMRWQQALQIWTIKEAYARLVGSRSHSEYAKFEVIASPWRVIDATGPGGALHLETHELTIGSQAYHLALTARPNERDAPFAKIRIVDSTNFDQPEAERRIPHEEINCGLTSVSWLFSPRPLQVSQASVG